MSEQIFELMLKLAVFTDCSIYINGWNFHTNSKMQRGIFVQKYTCCTWGGRGGGGRADWLCNCPNAGNKLGMCTESLSYHNVQNHVFWLNYPRCLLYFTEMPSGNIKDYPPHPNIIFSDFENIHGEVWKIYQKILPLAGETKLINSQQNMNNSCFWKKKKKLYESIMKVIELVGLLIIAWVHKTKKQMKKRFHGCQN